ncbi:hypothetical protein CBR_g22459 [Chara braunii]|uniref:Myb/SANT-like DNA-binding domain-containing protein n=1 Tax=Chara braunii TaxID=69332 RepID=A0A388L2Q1_CHABU|nr:hypothetical protein CBR_g22459 [Chara braunii]|eukprot:GBG76579.1 hypothetical protein CBR_g22459 [Chara braunii]
MDGRQAVCKSVGGEGGGQRAGQSPSRGSRAVERSEYAHLPPHLQPLPDTSDEEEDDRRSRAVPLGSGSTQEWTATELCGSREPSYGQSYTQLLQQGLSGDEGDGASSVRVASGNNKDPRTQQYRASSASRGASPRPSWMLSPSPLSGNSSAARNRGECGEHDCEIEERGDERDGREVWQEQRRMLHPRRQESITRGVQRLRVVDDENDGDAPDVGGNDQDLNDDDCGGGEDDAGQASVRNGGRGKKAMGKGSDVEADGDAEGGRHFWSVDDMVALIRAKRDQDAHLQGMGTAYARMKPREWKWLDVEQRLKKVGVERKAERCGKKWDNLMQQFKKVHHFQGLSGKQDFFPFTGKERLSKGFSFNMDRAVYDEILGSTAKSYTINPKNVADTGAPGGVRLPSTNSGDPESVGDGDAAVGLDDDDDGSTRGSSQTTGGPAGFGKRKSTRQQTFDVLSECMEKHRALVASTMESNSKRQCSIQIQQCEALEAEVEVQKKHYAASDEVSKLMCHALLEIAKAIRERSGRGRSAGKQAVDASLRDKRGRHVANKQRKLVQGASAIAIHADAEDWVAEGDDSHVESDFAESEEIPMKRKSSKRQTGALRIDDIGERRSAGCRGANEQDVNVAARPATGRAVGSAATQQNRAPLPRVNEPPASQEVFVRGRTPSTPRQTTATEVGVAAQGIAQGITSRSPARDERRASTVVAARAADVAKAGAATAGGASQAAEGGRSVGAATVRASHAVEGAREGGGNAGEGSRARAVAGVGEDDEALTNRLPLWFVGAYIEDRHEDDELVAYQEASVQRLVGAFTSAVSTAEGVDGGRVSHERLKSVAEAMQVMLAATMWLMRMGGGDRRAHYNTWVFVQLTAKPTLIASMHRSFDARRHIVQAATAITDKLAKPPITLLAPPLYIPDWVSIGVKFLARRHFVFPNGGSKAPLVGHRATGRRR